MTRQEAIKAADGTITFEWDEEGLQENGVIIQAWQQSDIWHFLVERSDHRGKRTEEYALIGEWYTFLGEVKPDVVERMKGIPVYNPAIPA